MEDSVQVRCKRCKTVFRDRAKRLQSGYSRQCPTCETIVFFEDDSQDPDIKRAMKTARRIRKELRESEAAPSAASASKASPQRSSGRLASQGRAREPADED